MDPDDVARNTLITILLQYYYYSVTSILLKEQTASSIIRVRLARRHSTGITHAHTHTAAVIFVTRLRRCRIGGWGVGGSNTAPPEWQLQLPLSVRGHEVSFQLLAECIYGLK